MRCCVYVGSTSRSPAERLAQHLDPPAHIKRTVVTECGGHLRPDLAPVRSFATRAAAEKAERELAARLRTRDYVVFGPRPPFHQPRRPYARGHHLSRR